MSLGFHWLNGSNTVNLGTAAVRLGTIAGLNTDGVTGGSSASTLTIDDPTGTLNLTGLRPFWVTEDAAPAGNQVVWHGRLGIRRVKRGGSSSPSLITDVERIWECDLVDDSGDLHNFMIQSGKRPAETAAARGAWLVAEDPLVNDYGKVHWPTLAMDAADYTGQYAADVLGDIAAQSGYNFFLYWDETNGGRGLWLDDPQSVNDTSSLRISNVLADLDGSTTWPTVGLDASLEIDPTRVASGVLLTHATGTKYVTNATTATAFTHIDRSAPMANIKTAAAALAAANRFLADNDEEDQRVSVTIRVPAAHVNDARVGQLIDAKFSHLPGFAAFRPCRILNRAVVADEEDDTQYKIPMLLSPGAIPMTCSTSVSGRAIEELSQQAYASGIISAPIGADAGAASLIVAMAVTSNSHFPQDSDLVGTGAFTTLTNFGGAGSGVLFGTTGGGTTNITGSYTGGYGANPDSLWAVAAGAFRTSATSPVQHKEAAPGAITATLDSAPTPGNMLLLAVYNGGDTNPLLTYPTNIPAGWTQIATATAESSTTAMCRSTLWARCVAPGDGSTWGLIGTGNATAVSVSEWAIA